MGNLPRFSKSSIHIPMLAIAMLVASGLWAGTTGKIAGRAYDRETGAALPGANIVISGTTMGASSDPDGLYFIINVPPGTYTLTATFIGYEGIVVQNVRVTVDRTTEQNFAMATTVVVGSEVTIIAERPLVDKDLTASMQVVSGDDMDNSWARSLPEVLEMQVGISQGHFRGGTLIESVYMLDNISLNSGVFSDNYTGINPTSIAEVVVLTGGYNAEYGSAQSGIVNIITKEAPKGIHATIVARMRPAGKYHWGSNMYSHENYDWTNYDLAYWTAASADDGSDYYGEDPAELLSNWQALVTGDEVQSKYAERAEYETEATVFGSLTPQLGFMLSGRFKRGVNIFPQQLDYNPEHNIQLNLSYKLSDRLKLSFSGLWGGYETSGSSPSNFNTIENSQEMAWNGMPQITEPYAGNKYAIISSWAAWPELRTVSNYSLKLTHALSASTFYEVWGNILSDEMDKRDRWGYTDEDTWSFDADLWVDPWIFQRQNVDADGNSITGRHWEDYFASNVLSVGSNISSQVNNNNFVKAGFEIKSYDIAFDHAMSAHEGGERWNLMNVYTGKPFEGAAYVQDKVEFSGMVFNGGLRLSFFNQNRDVAKNMFDPLAYESTTPGNVTDGMPGNPETEKTELQVAVSPRLGISHPITENTVLHFMYGHFNQRPSWNKMLGFPFINFTDDDATVSDPFAAQETYMDQWMGFLGNPKIGYARTIQYELGFDQNIADIFRLDVTAYYKDASRQTVFREATLYDPRWDDSNPWTTLYTNDNQYNVAMMASNSAYADIRGIETSLASNFAFPLNFQIDYDLSFSTGGVQGYSALYELGSGIDSRYGYGMVRKAWNNNHKIKAQANLDFYEGYGPAIAGIHPLEKLHANLYFEYWNGQQYTYHGPDDTSTKPNNKRWLPHFRTNLKIARTFDAFGVKTELALEVRNLFNNKDLNMLGGDDLINYHEKTELSDEDKAEGLTLDEARMPKHWLSGEPDVWGAYNQWTNPPRQLFFNLRVDI